MTKVFWGLLNALLAVALLYAVCLGLLFAF